MPKFRRSLAKVKALNSDALPTDHERTHLWPNTLFVDDEYLKSGASGYGKVWRVHSVVIDNKHKGNEKYMDYQLMYYDINKDRLGPPCSCEVHSGGVGCQMESSTVKEVVEWCEKYGEDIPPSL